jgi:hypothetical protein
MITQLPCPRGLVLLALLLALLPVAGQAAVDLYAAEVAVAGDAADERNRAIGEALAGVLVKLTGSRSVMSRPGADEILAGAPALVQQYRYRVDPAAEDGGGRLLWVRFDPAAVERAVSAQGWALWRQPRPRLLVWLGADRSGRRALLSPEATPELADALRSQGEARGVTVHWPLMDLEDQARLTPADLWSGFESAIREASQRYGDGPVLVARLSAATGGRWRSAWTLYSRGRVESFDGTTGDLPVVLAAGVDRAVDLLAGRLGPAVAGGSQALVEVQLRGVDTLRDYADVLELVGRAPGVSRLALRSALPDKLVFDVWLGGEAQALAEVLGADPRLQAESLPPGETGVSRLGYYWLP